MRLSRRERFSGDYVDATSALDRILQAMGRTGNV